MAAQKGVALVLALWLVVLLSMLGSSHARNVRLDTKLALNQIESVKAAQLAQSGVNHAILELYVKDPQLQLRFDGTPYLVDYPDGTVRLSIRSASGLVDLNAATAEVLTSLMTLRGVEAEQGEALVDAILDWRYKDDLRRIAGAEDKDYRFAGKEYGAADTLFKSIEELRYVMGMTPAIFERLRPFLTLHSGRDGVNLAYAPQELQAAFGGEEQEGEQLNPMTGPASFVYHINARGESHGGAVAVLEVVVNVSAGRDLPYRILSWREVNLVRNEDDV
jgi:general secretion pathway protein K